MCSRSPDIVDLNWPQPEAEAREHSEKLIEYLRDLVAQAGGWIGFADYMQAALYAPGLGYYSAGSAKFGATGDFVTAPEISPLFSRCVANQCAQVLMAGGGTTVVEPGAGSGAMAAEVLRALAELDAVPQRYVIVEPSADLRERQAQTIGERAGELLQQVSWVDQPPDPIDGIVIGNEVLDALPCERFVIEDGTVHALGVVWSGEGFAAAARRAGPGLSGRVEALQDEIGRRFDNGFSSELRPALPAYIADWAHRLHSGAIVWIDYGCSRSDYYSAERATGTLRCHYRHRAHDDPFAYPGLQDITAWVDFTAVAEAGVDAGLRLSGFTTQAHFLLGCGIEQQFTTLRSRLDDERQQAMLSGDAQKLLMPGQMGERFRVLAFERDLECDLLGFALRDMAAAL